MVKRQDFARPGCVVDPRHSRHPVLEPVFLLATESVIEGRQTVGVEANLACIRVSTKHDEARSVARTLHIAAMLARISPRDGDRHQAGMHRRCFDSVAVSFWKVPELV